MTEAGSIAGKLRVWQREMLYRALSRSEMMIAGQVMEDGADLIDANELEKKVLETTIRELRDKLRMMRMQQ